MVHEPLAHGRASEWREILISRGVGSGRGDDGGVGHRAFPLQNVEHPGDVGIFLPNRDVNTEKRPVIDIVCVLGRLVQSRLANDCVDRHSRFTGRAVADDQLALPATDRDHGVDRHNAGLHRLIDASAFDHARCNFFQWIKCFRFDCAFAVERLANGVDDATEQRFAHWHLQESAGRLRLVAFGDFGGFTEQNGADFRLFEVQRDAIDAIWKFNHLVEHHVA